MSDRTPNHTCLICDTKYYACDDCDSKIGKLWRALCCSPLHYQIHFIVIGLRDKTMNENEAKSFLNHLCVSDKDIEFLKENIQEILLPLFNT